MGILDIVVGPLFKIIDKVIPDPAAKAAAQLEMIKLQQAGEFKQMEAELALATAQTDINKVEAQDPSLFKSGWRPGAGWICVAGLGYQFLLMPILPWFITVCGGHVAPLPPIDNGTLMTLLGGLLGLGGLRSFDKAKGTS